MGRFVIVAYAPKPGNEEALLELVKSHIGILRSEDLVTDRSASVMRAANGTLVEVFEWKSAAAIEQAHANPAVQKMWEEFAAVCDYVPLTQLGEAQQMFAEFDAVEF